VNDGTIDAGYNGGLFLMNWTGVTLCATQFVNKGTIAVSNGDAAAITNLVNDGSITVSNGAELFLYGTVTAAAIDSITINSGGAVFIQGTVKGGTIDAPSGGIGGYGGAI